MKQRTLAMMTGLERYTRKTRRAIFLEEMEQVVPWRELCGLVEPLYPKPGNWRPPVGVERMLRIYFFAAVVEPVGPGGRRGAVRLRGRRVRGASRARDRRLRNPLPAPLLSPGSFSGIRH